MSQSQNVCVPIMLIQALVAQTMVLETKLLKLLTPYSSHIFTWVLLGYWDAHVGPKAFLRINGVILPNLYTITAPSCAHE